MYGDFYQMKSIALQSLVNAHRSLVLDDFKAFKIFYGVDVSDEEIVDFSVLLDELEDKSSSTFIFNDFYVGYKIKHISKEFDLLRFGRGFNINVEVKKSSSEEKILKQLTRNRYYLGHMGCEVFCYCFISSSRVLYQLGSSESLEIVGVEVLIDKLKSQAVNKVSNPDCLFNPSDYLVSPFNSTDDFIENRYFLTGQQEEFKRKIIRKIASSENEFISLSGSAGTGKTLTAYDIVKECMKSGKASVIHCGKLNSGHSQLGRNGWFIYPVSRYRDVDFVGSDIILIDEAQRMRTDQLEYLVEKASENGFSIIFSYDEKQTLSYKESLVDMGKSIKSLQGVESFRLSEKIRTNKDVSSFIKMILNRSRNNISVDDSSNISFEYFTNISDVKNYVNRIQVAGWNVLKMTPSRYNDESHEKYAISYSSNSHEIIGQEFDHVAVVVDQYFSYLRDGRLSYRSITYYDAVKMLFQNMTRTRISLKIIILGNADVLRRCMTILG